MTASQAPRPLAPLPIRVRPQRAETTGSYARRLARANHLRPSYLRTFLCDPPRHTGAIRPWRLAAISGRSVRALEHALADLTQGSPPGRQPRAPGSVRTLISTWLLTEPELTPAQIWQRLLDEHDAGISYTTIGHYRRSIINSHYRLNTASRAGSDDSNQPQSPVTAAFIRTSDASPIASQTGPARTEPQSRADLSGTGHAGDADERKLHGRIVMRSHVTCQCGCRSLIRPCRLYRGARRSSDTRVITSAYRFEKISDDHPCI